MTTVISMQPISNTSIARSQNDYIKADQHFEHYRSQYTRKKNVMCKNRYQRRGVLSIILYICALIGVITCLNTAAHVFAADVRTTELNGRSQYTSILVQPGDTLLSIAQNYMSDDFSSISEYARYIQEINHMDNDLLVAGNHIVIPIDNNN